MTRNLTTWVGEAARKRTGRFGRLLYSMPLARSYRRILDQLQLGQDNVLLEIGPGGGVFMAAALERAGRAAALDHSPDMVAETRRRNAKAVAERRLEVMVGEAAHLPWPDHSFTVAVMNQVLFWLPDPERTLKEVCRVLPPGGRLAMLSADDRRVTRLLIAPYLRSGARLLTNREVEALLESAGFGSASVNSTGLGVQFIFASR